MVRLLIIVVVLLSSATISKAETICIQDIPNPGDSTCTTTYSTGTARSEEHTSELQSQSTISYAVFCLKKKKKTTKKNKKKTKTKQKKNT
mgnify:CR=1 FL=1